MNAVHYLATSSKLNIGAEFGTWPVLASFVCRALFVGEDKEQQPWEPSETPNEAPAWPHFLDGLFQVLFRVIWSGPPNPIHITSLYCSQSGIHHRLFYLGERWACTWIWVHAAHLQIARLLQKVHGLAYQRKVAEGWTLARPRRSWSIAPQAIASRSMQEARHALTCHGLGKGSVGDGL